MAGRFHYGPWLAAAALIAGGALVWHHYPRDPQPAAPASAPQAAPLAPAPAPLAPEVQHPIDQVPVLPGPPAEPLPALDQSDAEALAALDASAGGSAASERLVAQFLLPRLVATIDNLPRRTLTTQVYAARPVPGTLALAEADGRLWLDDSNRGRYDSAVALFEGLDSRLLVSTYVRFYPLLQQAYRDLGVPDRQFNDRLVEVIDHLLLAPDATGPIELRRIPGSPRLAFAEPKYEAASVGHRALLRLGPDHAARVKAKLRELRGLLAGQRPTG